ncbi:MAG: DNA repair protein RadC [Anaerosomatales bacterium]|nr:DNA repair protein RadC [Anaerosomatales bacterium]
MNERIASIISKPIDDPIVTALAIALQAHPTLVNDRVNETVAAYPGAGPAIARKINAAIALGIELLARPAGLATQLSSPEDVLELMKPRCYGLVQEHFWLITLNTKNHLINVHEVSVGSLNASIVHPRELFRHAIKDCSAAAIVCHNHPSGDPTPSGADIQLTRRLVKAGDVLGIELLDHVVIGDTTASLRELNLM